MEKKLKEEVELSTKREMEAYANLKQGDTKEPKKCKRLTKENKHL